jgi:hypothetical protein
MSDEIMIWNMAVVDYILNYPNKYLKSNAVLKLKGCAMKKYGRMESKLHAF